MNFKVGRINNNTDKGSCLESHFDFTGTETFIPSLTTHPTTTPPPPPLITPPH